MAPTSSVAEEKSSRAEDVGSRIRLLYGISVGINLTSSQYRGLYPSHTTSSHPPDIPSVLARARSIGVRKFLVTGSDLQESRAAIELAKQHPGVCYATVGVHPCSVNEFEEAERRQEGGGDKMLRELEHLAREGAARGFVKAWGEIGLDWDRLGYADKETQMKWFEKQLEVAER
ncbi:MAG: hypothetical protein Q9190_005607, partial [Brigantiaea leucoxantha]